MIFIETQKFKEVIGFTIVSTKLERPQGGFLVINETQAQAFSNQLFKGLDKLCVVAVTWQHTDANHPSDEDNIIR